ncbi:D-tyrosyl-tRNA(Tyr) deacylase [Aspergillus cristatus]|uniref:D-aminoacyl-tRNA deacylase n=1 Tax=Aspergillus cristatus TaxID=573508 RepID=A0A1E3B645_ASPCR|nr:D-tyrosyl-tRNA(Tyr) deacylase [Aspergillus cristatus]
MKAVIQRVKSASVTVDNQLVSSIGRGLLVLAGVGKGDDEKEADSLISRIIRCRLWPDDNGKQWKKNVQDIEGEILCVSQFTLYAQLNKGKQPDFHEAADVETARRLYDYFHQRLCEAYKPERVKNGVFQAMMDVELKNDGPVTIEVNTKLPKKEKTPEGDKHAGKKPEKPEKSGKAENTGKAEGDSDKGGQTEGQKSYEFKLPATLLE